MLVLFGVTGDLASKKLLPAIYDLANSGSAAAGLLAGRLRPPGLGGRGLRADHSRRGQGARAHAVPRGGMAAAVRGHQIRAGRVRRRRGVRPAGRRPSASWTRDRGTGGNYAFYLSVPPNAFPVVVQQLKRSGLSSAPSEDGTGRGAGW